MKRSSKVPLFGLVVTMVFASVGCGGAHADADDAGTPRNDAGPDVTMDSGVPDAGPPAPPCNATDIEFANHTNPFAVAPTLGAQKYVNGLPTDLEVGFDATAEVMAYNDDFTQIDLWSDPVGGIRVYWPQVISTFSLHEMIHVTRTADWLILRGSAGDVFNALSVSTGSGLHGALEALPDDGPVLRPVEQCRMPAAGGCETSAVAIEGTRGSETVVINSGWGAGMENNVWTIWNKSSLRRGTCDSPASAQVVEVMALLYKRNP